MVVTKRRWTCKVFVSKSFHKFKFNFKYLCKKRNSDWLFLSSGAGENKYFDLENGVIGNVGTASDTQIEAVGDGWYRCTITVSNGELENISRSWRWSCKWFSWCNIYIQSAQLEVGSYATSYIPTQGGVVTRNQDSCSQTVPSGIIGQTEGSIYCEVNISNTSGKSLIALDTGSASNFIVLSTSSSLSPQIQIRQSSGSYPSIISGTTMNYGVNKIAFCYKSGDYAMYINGVLSGTSTSTTFPSGVISQISVGASSSYGYLSDTVNDVKIYNTRLSNAELQALTTL